MPLYEVTLEQSYAGQQIINRWNYNSNTIPVNQSGSFMLVAGMGFCPNDPSEPFAEGTIAGELKQRQVDDVTFVQVIARNLYSVTDFYTYAFPANTHGDNTVDEGEAPFVCVGFTSDKTRADIKRAQKRFAGIPETQVGPNGMLTDAAKASYAQIGDAMDDVLAVAVGETSATFTPFVFGREKYHPPGKTTWAYRYYETEEQQLEHIARINQWSLKPQVRSQTSRQYGRGA